MISFTPKHSDEKDGLMDRYLEVLILILYFLSCSNGGYMSIYYMISFLFKKSDVKKING